MSKISTITWQQKIDIVNAITKPEYKYIKMTPLSIKLCMCPSTINQILRKYDAELSSKTVFEMLRDGIVSVDTVLEKIKLHHIEPGEGFKIEEKEFSKKEEYDINQLKKKFNQLETDINKVISFINEVDINGVIDATENVDKLVKNFKIMDEHIKAFQANYNEGITTNNKIMVAFQETILSLTKRLDKLEK